jgi:hypothetical protein
MAELIPLEYRLATAQSECMRRWGFVLALTAVMAGAGLFTAYNGQRKCRLAFEEMKANYADRSMIKRESFRLIEQRKEIASRMSRIQKVQDDRTLLTLLASVTEQFSDNDVLEDIVLEVHGRGGEERNPPGSFNVRVGAFTRSYDTWNELIDRLTKASAKSDPPMAIKPGSASDAKVLDGQVVKFQVSFDPPARVADASAGGK